MNHSNDKAAGCCPACFYVGDVHENAHGIPDPNTSDCKDDKCSCHSKPPTDSEDDAIEEIVKDFSLTFCDGKNREDYLRRVLRSYGDKVREEEIKKFWEQYGGLSGTKERKFELWEEALKEEGRREEKKQLLEMLEYVAKNTEVKGGEPSVHIGIIRKIFNLEDMRK